jgi:hypothetical protein
MKPAIIGMMALLLFTGMYSVGGAEEEITQTIQGEGNINVGQIASGNSRYESPIQHRWLQSNSMIIGDSVTSGSRISMKIEFEGLLRFATEIQNDPQQGLIEARLPNLAFYIRQAWGTYVFGNPEIRPFSITMGFFPYKYNPDVKNIGEYLFRSMAYPNYVNNWFDEPFMRMLGFNFSSRLLGGNLRQDLLLTSEWSQYPTKDFSLAYVAGFKIGSYLDIGAGGQAFHLFTVRGNYTSPDGARSKGYAGSWYYASQADSIAQDSSFYTFKGIKLMGRINIHPLASVPEIKLPIIGTLFGKEDLNLYAEANVLGLKNYKTYYAGDINNPMSDPKKFEFYNKLSERIPVTFGINAPTNPLFAYGIIPTATFLFAKERSMFKDMGHRVVWSAGSVAATAAALLLQNKLGLNVRPDVLGFEFEYWSNPYPNSWWYAYKQFIPIPDYDPQNITYEHNRWRWSVYTTKRIGNFFAKLQIAHDHLTAYQPQLGYLGTVDNLGAAGYWWWTLKTGYSF